jgi:hypothetical protein
MRVERAAAHAAQDHQQSHIGQRVPLARSGEHMVAMPAFRRVHPQVRVAVDANLAEGVSARLSEL